MKRIVCDIVRLAASTALIAFAGLAPVVGTSREASACGGDPIPFCGTTYVLSVGGPLTAITTPAIPAVITLNTVHFFDQVEVPPGSGICPPPGYFLTITVTGTCPTGSPAPVVVGPIPIAPGFTSIPVDVVFPPGAQRECVLSITGTVTLTNGAALSQTQSRGVCLVRPAPNNPTVPRLSLLPIGPTFNLTHPGDQTANTYRLTNNDPVLSWTGTLDAAMVNVATRPAGPPDTVFAVSDPGPGDNYPMMFQDELPPGGCIPLPANPHAHVSTLTRNVTLLPGESREITIVVRPWGMCTNGSCGQKTVKIDGTFSNGARGFACAGATVGVATSVPPGYLWPDAGRAILFAPGLPFPPQIILTGFPDPTPTPRGGRLTIDPTSQRVFVGPIELPSQFITQPLPLDPLSSEPEGARFQSNIDVPPLLTSFFDVFWEIDLSPNNPNTGPIRLENMDVVPDAPSGIADRAPIAMGVATVQGIGVVDSFFDIFYQISGEGRGVSGNPIPIRFDQLELTPLGLGNVLRVRARVQSINPGSEPFTGFTIRQDFRGFARLGGGGGGPSCGSIDFNNDTSFFDPTDIEAFLSVFSEGPCIPVTATCNSIDFNNDTSFFDPCDIDSFLLVFSEGPCTLCGV